MREPFSVVLHQLAHLFRKGGGIVKRKPSHKLRLRKQQLGVLLQRIVVQPFELCVDRMRGVQLEMEGHRQIRAVRHLPQHLVHLHAHALVAGQAHRGVLQPVGQPHVKHPVAERVLDALQKRLCGFRLLLHLLLFLLGVEIEVRIGD